MAILKPQNLFTSTSFLLIIFGALLYAKPIILLINDRGLNTDRAFELVQGLALGAVVTKRKMNVPGSFTPKGIPGKDEEDAIAEIIAMQTPVVEASKVVASTIDAVQDAEQTINEAAKPINNIAEEIAPKAPSAKTVAKIKLLSTLIR